MQMQIYQNVSKDFIKICCKWEIMRNILIKNRSNENIGL